MGVPKKRITSSTQGQRRKHLRLKPINLIACPKCGQQTKPHQVCRFCGFYKGKEVVNVLARLDKKERKAREKNIKETEKEAQAPKQPEA